jgi:hypothetical protein
MIRAADYEVVTRFGSRRTKGRATMTARRKGGR